MIWAKCLLCGLRFFAANGQEQAQQRSQKEDDNVHRYDARAGGRSPEIGDEHSHNETEDGDNGGQQHNGTEAFAQAHGRQRRENNQAGDQ